MVEQEEGRMPGEIKTHIKKAEKPIGRTKWSLIGDGRAPRCILYRAGVYQLAIVMTVPVYSLLFNFTVLLDHISVPLRLFDPTLTTPLTTTARGETHHVWTASARRHPII